MGTTINTQEFISATQIKAAEKQIDQFASKFDVVAEKIETVSQSFSQIKDVLRNMDWSAAIEEGATKLVNTFGLTLKNQFEKQITSKMETVAKTIVENVDKGFKEIPKLFVSGGKIYEFIGELGMNLSIFVETITGFSIPVGVAMAAVVAAIALVIAGIIELWNTSETFRDNVQNMLDVIGGAFMVAKVMIWDMGLKPLWDSIKEFFGSLYQIYVESGLKDIFETVVTAIGYIGTAVIGSLILAISGLVMFLFNIVQTVLGVLNDILGGVKLFVDKNKEFFDGVKQIFHGLTEFLAGVFSGDWERAWNGVKTILSGVWSAIVGIIKSPINTISVIIELLINGIIGAFNSMKSAINSIKFTVPDWVPLIGGKKFYMRLEMTPTISIPRFAKGGFPNTGELFLARENGIAEMVGRMGTRPAVANNDQIAEGFASAVYPAMHNAVADAMAAVMLAQGAGQAEGTNRPLYINVMLPNHEVLAKAVYQGNESLKRRGLVPAY